METLTEPVLKPDEAKKDKTKGGRISSKDLPIWKPERPTTKYDSWREPMFKRDQTILQSTLDELRLEETGYNNKGVTYASPLKNIWVTLAQNPEDPKSYRVVEDSHGGEY